MKLKESKQKMRRVASSHVDAPRNVGCRTFDDAISTEHMLLDSSSLEVLERVRKLQAEGFSLDDAIARAANPDGTSISPTDESSGIPPRWRFNGVARLLIENSERLAHFEELISRMKKRLDDIESQTQRS